MRETEGWHDPADLGHFLCVDLKSFYASVECVDRDLDPLEADLVVADWRRGDGTLCLAVSPHLKAQGVPNRCRVRDIPADLRYVKALPRMRRYMEASAAVYDCYLAWLAPDDVYAYSVDECFMDVGPYLGFYDTDARGIAGGILSDVLARTGLVATAGIGTNIFLAKVACDILAKHDANFIGELDGESFRRRIWTHRPIADIWGVGTRTAARLEGRLGCKDLRDVSRVPWETLHAEFGSNARYLHDHSRGVDATSLHELGSYVPQAHSISNGQVLMRDYTEAEAVTVALEMLDESILRLTGRGLLASSVSAWVGWSDAGALSRPGVGGTTTLPSPTDSRTTLQSAVRGILSSRLTHGLPIRRVGISMGGLVPREGSQPSLFEDELGQSQERDLSEAMIEARSRFGPTALMWGRSLTDAGTGYERNLQVGGHRA